MLQINVGERRRKGKINDSINNLRTLEGCWIMNLNQREMDPPLGKKRARSDLAAEKYVKWYLTSVFSQTFYSRGV